jgi:hypothetical protein
MGWFSRISLVVIGHWSLVIGYWLLAVGCWVLAIRHLEKFKIHCSCELRSIAATGWTSFAGAKRAIVKFSIGCQP